MIKGRGGTKGWNINSPEVVREGFCEAGERWGGIEKLEGVRRRLRRRRGRRWREAGGGHHEAVAVEGGGEGANTELVIRVDTTTIADAESRRKTRAHREK